MPSDSSDSLSLRHLLVSPEAERKRDTEDEEPGLPSLVEAEYRPHGEPANKPLFSLHFVSPSGDIRSFQYHHLDSDSRYSGGAMKIRFVGAPSLGLPPIQILIEGRNLRTLYDYIHHHRVPWILTAARDFARDKEMIVTGVTFTELRSPDGEEQPHNF